MRIHISYEPEDEGLVVRIVDQLRDILPRHKVKKKPGKAPYSNVYFIPRRDGEPGK